MLAAFGCSSNQYAGNGQPTPPMPTMNSINHSTTYGSSSGTEGNPPMASSYYANTYATPSVDVDALANQAAQRGFRGVVLGPASPDGGTGGIVIATGQFQNPAAVVNPQSTVNSSISSGPTPVITGGPVGAGVDILPTGVVVAPAAAAAVTTGTAATTGALTAATGTSTVAGSAAFSPLLMNSTPAPQATGTANATLPTIAATGRGPVLTTAPATVGAAATTAAPAVRTLATANATVAGGIQIQTTQAGGILVTNVAHAPTTASGH